MDNATETTEEVAARQPPSGVACVGAVAWQSLDPRTHVVVPYAAKVSERLEAAYAASLGRCHITINNVPYFVDFGSNDAMPCRWQRAAPSAAYRRCRVVASFFGQPARNVAAEATRHGSRWPQGYCGTEAQLRELLFFGGKDPQAALKEVLASLPCPAAPRAVADRAVQRNEHSRHEMAAPRGCSHPLKYYFVFLIVYRK